MGLSSAIRSALQKDNGLKSSVSDKDMTKGLAAVDRLATLLARVINDLDLNADGRITEADMRAVSHAVRYEAVDYWAFVDDHGDDEGDEETGYHLLQDDGSTLTFQGRNFADTIIDAIFHFGFKVDEEGHFENEDGNQNEAVADVAGWVNYFLNGVNMVYGTSGQDQIGSGVYSPVLAAAADETFDVGGGNDTVWAEEGNDTVWTGTGNDNAGGGTGNDTLYGENGQDTLYGEEGKDRIEGGAGADVMGLGSGNDRGMGGADNDRLYGEEGTDTLLGEDGDDLIYGGADNDRAEGGAGRDTLGGDDGADVLFGGSDGDAVSGGEGADLVRGDAGNDTLSGGSGADTVVGGAGADSITLWEDPQSRDVLVFRAGDSGRSLTTIDTVEGFVSGTDKIDLRAFPAWCSKRWTIAAAARPAAITTAATCASTPTATAPPT